MQLRDISFLIVCSSMILLQPYVVPMSSNLQDMHSFKQPPGRKNCVCSQFANEVLATDRLFTFPSLNINE